MMCRAWIAVLSTISCLVVKQSYAQVPTTAPPVGAVTEPTTSTPAGLPAVLGGLELGSNGAAAKERQKEQRTQLEELINSVMDVPGTPAAFALDVAADQVARPSSLRDAGAQLLGFIDSEGSFRPGVAVEVAPVELASKRTMTVDDYLELNALQRILRSVRFSLATAKDANAPEGTEAPTLASLGLRLGWDERDYRYNPRVVKAVRTVLAAHAPTGPVCPHGVDPPPDGCTSPDFEEQEAVRVAKELDQAYEGLEEGLRVELAAATVVEATSLFGSEDSADYRYSRLWLAGDYAFGSSSLGLAADYRLLDGNDVGSDGGIVSELRAGGRFDVAGRHGGFALQAGYISTRLGEQEESASGVLVGVSATVKLWSTLVVRAGLTGVYADDRFTSALVISTDWGTYQDLALYGTTFN